MKIWKGVFFMLTNKKMNDIAVEYITELKKNGTSSDYVIESMYRLHIQNEFGNRKIKSIKLKDMRELQNNMFTKRHGGKPYSNKTINMVTSVFNMILNYAVRNEYLKSNPCTGFKKMKTIKTYGELQFWTDEEFRKAIVYEEDFMWYCYLVISYLTGMRKGEMRGLQWKDVNFSKGIIVINRHINDKLNEEQRKQREKARIINGRKNGGSHIILMDNNTNWLLRELKHYTMSHPKWNLDFFVFGNENPVGQNSPKRHLDVIAEKACLNPIKIHGLRHSHVSFLISKGLNAYEIAERIGDTVEMVLKVYGHMFPNPQKNIVTKLNESFDFKHKDVFGNVILSYEKD